MAENGIAGLANSPRLADPSGRAINAGSTPRGYDPINNPEDLEWFNDKKARKGGSYPWWRFGKQGRYDELQGRQQGSIRKMHQGAFGAALETFQARRGYGNRQAAGQLGFQGLAPSTFTSLIQPEADYRDAGTMAAMRLDSNRQTEGDLAQLDINITEAKASEERYYDRQRLDEELASKSRRDARHASKAANTTALIGAGAGAVGMAVGGGGGGGGTIQQGGGPRPMF